MLQRRSVRAVVWGLLGLAVLGLAGCPAPQRYVALGDSYTSGPGVPTQTTEFVPVGCLQSDQNYPHLIRPRLTGITEFRDASCSGGQTKDMLGSQTVDPPPANDPQFERLTTTTKVVTLGVGGNDIGFVDIAETCVRLASEQPIAPSPCQDHYAANGEITAALGTLSTDLRDVLDGIDQRAPSAKVFVVGYPAILPETIEEFGPDCRLLLPVARGDVAFLRDQVEKALNAVINFTSVAHGEVYVDTYTSSMDHDACKLPGTRWVEPVFPAAAAFPVHPNAAGMQNSAAAVAAVMQANGVAVS